MNATEQGSETPAKNWYRESECSLEAFADQLRNRVDRELRFPVETEHEVPIYDCRALDEVLIDPVRQRTLQAEWANVLLDGAGVLVLKNVFRDTAPVDEATRIFEEIIRQERESGTHGADHFAKAGANDRIWNAQEKLCLQAPSVFARYFSNAFIACVAQAWLGPGYQMTAQVNVVRPGGEAQQAHRDYHLGFQTVEEVQRFPAHVHKMSPFLTLQGAVAHSDMPIQSGPTKLLPFSQRYAEGYLACRRPDFRNFFEAHCVQLPLAKGDALFFNPALFHAAGANRTSDVQRMANLLQVSSAYGRAMETVDRMRMCEAVYPILLEYQTDGKLTSIDIDFVIACTAEGYAFPTNLDRDPPAGGLAPTSQQALLRRALDETWPQSMLREALQLQAWKRTS
ncbi:phytanoyl-CoA dioxygenase [Burkholderia sp. SG-MS1]|uniref:phytanoyl-CoA dioxygenase family protein n=1 Tax=Paraburkholderia sp. SG-MS1 TaxID=2023741 RepID=UPI001447A96E|nr:phytanoyl-CoA dioxygenase family protein [Paraburkholderia sp. SG-MS1]NKJ47672.1 phytanoyl-CoA dioxygenase [Paraburkholderia sp. SG-MS1]